MREEKNWWNFNPDKPLKIGGLTEIGDFLFRFDTCGAEVESGIANVSGHWAECAGKETMSKVNAIAENNNSVDDKMKEIKTLFNL